MVQIKDRQGYRGSFNLQVYDADGKLIRDYRKHNLIVDSAKGVMARLVGGDFDGYAITDIACGDSDAAADVTDTDITNAFVKQVIGISFPEPDQVQFDWHLASEEYNGKTIKELGLLTENGTLFARIVLDAPIPKTSQFSMDVQWVIEFTNKDEEEEEGDGESD
jgi:hypothetical protein